MANIYTKDDTSLSNKVFFLNGNNLTHVLNIDGKVNPIPSLTLMANVNRRVTKLSTEVQELNKTNELETGKILRSLSQDKGQVSYTFSQISDDDFADGTLSQSKIRGLVEDLGNISSEYLLTSDFKSTLASSFRFDDTAKDFRYDADRKQFILDVCGKEMTINLADVISSKIITKIEVIEKTSPEGVKYKALRIFFDTEYKDFVDINLNDLVKVYKAGDGINISEDLTISATSNIVRIETINNLSCDYEKPSDIITSLVQTNGKVVVGSTKLLSSHVEGLDTYVNKKIGDISGVSFIEHGIIKSIKQENGKITYLSGPITSADFIHYDGETHPHECLPVNYIDGLDDRLSTLEDTDWRSLKFNGHIRNTAFFSRQNYLSDVFNNGGIQDFSTLYNGSFIEINFDDGVLSAKTLSDDTVYENGDYLIIHNHDSAKRTMTPSEIVVGKTAFLIRGGMTKGEVESHDASVLLSAKNYTNEICASLSNCVKDNYFNLNEDEVVNGNITFNNGISAYYTKIYDLSCLKLSDKVVIDDTFGGIYNGIVNIISECELDKDGIRFGLEQPVISAYNTINKIADSKVNVPEAKIDIETATVEDASNAIRTIVSQSTYSIYRNLNNELEKIDKRFDVVETAVGNHTDKIASLEKEIEDLKQKNQNLESRLKNIEYIFDTNNFVTK